MDFESYPDDDDKLLSSRVHPLPCKYSAIRNRMLLPLSSSSVYDSRSLLLNLSTAPTRWAGKLFMTSRLPDIMVFIRELFVGIVAVDPVLISRTSRNRPVA